MTARLSLRVPGESAVTGHTERNDALIHIITGTGIRVYNARRVKIAFES